MDKRRALQPVHQAVLDFGQDQIGNLAGRDRRVFGIAARFMADERVDPIYSHPGLCLTVLPHREIHVGQSWRRQTGYAELMILPLEGHDGRTRGVPFGVKARLILLYLMTEAVKTRSRQIELGRSMRAWMTSMGVPSCGKNIKTIADQCDRIEHCVLSFKLNDSTEASLRDGIIRGSFRNIGVEGEPRVVELSQGFYDTIIRRPVPVVEAAVRTLADTCMPLDLYLWLAYRLHVLERPVPVSWASLHAQFGAGTQQIKHFKPRFQRDLELAKAVYPEARADMTDRGVTLFPSPPPIAARLVSGR